MQYLSLAALCVLFLSSCGKTKDEYIWNDLTPEAREAIKNQVAKKCADDLKSSFAEITESTLDSYNDGGGDLRDGSSLTWKRGSETGSATIIILKLREKDFLFYVKKNASSAQVHGTTPAVKTIYKVKTEDNSKILSTLRQLACNGNTDSKYDVGTKTVTSAVYSTTDIDNRTETVHTYVINDRIPAVFTLFAFTYSFKEITEGTVSGEDNFAQTITVGSTVAFDSALINEIKASGVKHCTFASTSWSGANLSEPQPTCAAGSLNNDLDDIFP
jgi:hypothetical protein